MFEVLFGLLVFAVSLVGLLALGCAAVLLLALLGGAISPDSDAELERIEEAVRRASANVEDSE